MRKQLLLLHFFSSLFACAVGQTQTKWDKPMQLKSCTIYITADYFKSRTFIEMEFFNPRDTEMEGLYNFQLNPGQVITAFQLELNGKYRDGSIEEKWKATNAYNTIVGKRIDPALLRMEAANSYTLRIYPMPARGSRKITFTIEQLMKVQPGRSSYSLPFNHKDTVSNFSLRIDVDHTYLSPLTDVGLIRHLVFNKGAENFYLEWKQTNTVLNNWIQFKIPVPENSSIACVQKHEEKLHWATLLNKKLEKNYEINPKRILIYWDISSSAANRNTRKEIQFLEQYIINNNIEQLTIVPFNHQLQDSVIFYPQRGYNNRWQQYLNKLEYDGATQFGCLDFDVNTDLILLFSDGHNSFGKPLPEKGRTPVHAVFDAKFPDKRTLETVIEGSGGQIVDLDQLNPVDAINTAGKIDCYLMGITAIKGKLISHQYFPINVESLGILSGAVSGGEDTLVFHFGNNTGIRRIEKIAISPSSVCETKGLERIPMLCVFQTKITQGDWGNTLEFGMIEKVVTPYTAYIVLERIEDYIKYNITPPTELEEQCRELNFVKKDFRKQLEEIKNQNQWNAVVGEFNQLIGWWDANASLIDLNANFGTQLNFFSSSPNLSLPNVPDLSGRVSGSDFGSRSMSLQEVVVVGYGTSIRRDMTGAVSRLYSPQLYNGLSIEQQLAGRVAGVHVQSNTGSKENGLVRIRGISSLYGSNQPLYILDGVPLESNHFLHLINPNDIETIDILKGASATGLYGGRGANGVILITTKKGRRSYPYNYGKNYKLKNLQDVEYIEEIKNLPVGLRLNKYEELRLEHGNMPAFYFDMADHFFSIGNSKKAVSILLNAAEISSGNISVLKSIGHFFEKWKMWDRAIDVFAQLAALTGRIHFYRDLGWTYYQAGKYQNAIKTLYSAILLETHDPHLKATLLTEINAIIAAHRDGLYISFIPAALIKPMPVDLRILVDGVHQSYGMSVTDPAGVKRHSFNSEASSNWRIRHMPGLEGDLFEYQIKKAKPGIYRVSIGYYDYSSKSFDAPAFFRIISFSNFARTGQKITVEMVSLDNQQGEIEVATTRWPENTR